MGDVKDFSGAECWPSSLKASLIWRRARALSKGVMGMSPQSIIVAQDLYGLRFARGL